MKKSELLKFFDVYSESGIHLPSYRKEGCPYGYNLDNMKYLGFAKERGTGVVVMDEDLNSRNASYVYGLSEDGDLYFIDRNYKPYRAIMLRRTMFLLVPTEECSTVEKTKSHVFRYIDNDDFTFGCYIRPELLNTFREEQIWEERKFVYHYYYLPKEFR